MKYPSRPTVLSLMLAAMTALGVPPALAEPMNGMPQCHGLPSLPLFPPPPMPGEFPLLPLLHGLNLSEAQRDQVFAVLHGAMSRQRSALKAVHQAGQALRDLALSGRYEEGRAGELAESFSRATAAAALVQARIDAELVAVLTPEQRQQLEQRKAGLAGCR